MRSPWRALKYEILSAEIGQCRVPHDDLRRVRRYFAVEVECIRRSVTVDVEDDDDVAPGPLEQEIVHRPDIVRPAEPRHIDPVETVVSSLRTRRVLPAVGEVGAPSAREAKVSAPVPPESASLPVPPSSVSSPAPPNNRSAPLPPISVSRPSPMTADTARPAEPHPLSPGAKLAGSRSYQQLPGVTTTLIKFIYKHDVRRSSSRAPLLF